MARALLNIPFDTQLLYGGVVHFLEFKDQSPATGIKLIQIMH